MEREEWRSEEVKKHVDVSYRVNEAGSMILARSATRTRLIAVHAVPYRCGERFNYRSRRRADHVRKANRASQFKVGDSARTRSQGGKRDGEEKHN